MKRICFICLLGVFMLMAASCGKAENTRDDYMTGSSQEDQGQEKDSLVSEKMSGKVLVTYFTRNGNTDNDFPDGVDAIASASIQTDGEKKIGNAERVAEWIAEKTDGTLHAITTSEKYPSDYDKTVDYAKEEQREGIHPELTSKVEDMDSFQTVVLVFPNWWTDLPMPVYSFFDKYDLKGKNIVVFCTHGGSGFSDTVSTVKELEPEAVVTEGLAIYHDDVEDAEDKVIEKVEELGIGK